ncbi:E3 binding domain-containing protein [Shigella flexneri]
MEEQNNDALSPAIRRLLAEHNLDASAIKGTGVGGRLTREDVEKHLAKARRKSLLRQRLIRRRNRLWLRVVKNVSR